MQRYHIPWVLMLCVICSSASAANLSEKYGVPTPLRTDIQKKVFSTLFNIELWSYSYPQQYDQGLTIRIIFASRFDNSDVVQFLAEESQEIHGFSKKQLKVLLDSISKSVTCDPKANSILDFNYIPKKGVMVTCNGKKNPISIPDGPLSFQLLDVFLHSKSEYKNLSENVSTAEGL